MKGVYRLFRALLRITVAFSPAVLDLMQVGCQGGITYPTLVGWTEVLQDEHLSSSVLGLRKDE